MGGEEEYHLEVVIRPAVPDDVEDAIPCIYSSGPRAFDFVFGHRTRIDALEFLRQAFRVPGLEFSYDNHIVAEVDGRVVATGAGFTGEHAKAHFMPTVRAIIRAYGLGQCWGVMQRGMAIEKLIEPPKGKEYCIAHLGVDPELRGTGIGSKVIHHLLEDAAKKKADYVFLDVSVENPKAEALYERMGFNVVAENISKLENSTAKVPDHRRMVRPTFPEN